jgi:hypothetical protein
MPVSPAPPDESCDPWLPDEPWLPPEPDESCDSWLPDEPWLPLEPDESCDPWLPDDEDCEEEDCEGELGDCCGVVQATIRLASSKHVVQRVAIERLTRTEECGPFMKL